MTVTVGCHNENGGVAVHHNVPSQQADLLVAPDLAEIPVLLVRERLDRRGIDGSRVVLARHEDSELANDGLARAGRRSDQDRVAVRERADGVELKVIELVGLLGGELVDEFFVRHLRLSVRLQSSRQPNPRYN